MKKLMSLCLLALILLLTGCSEKIPSVNTTPFLSTEMVFTDGIFSEQPVRRRMSLCLLALDRKSVV